MLFRNTKLRIVVLAAIGSFLLFIFPAWAGAANSCGRPLETNGEWPTSSPEDAGLDGALLCSLSEMLDKSPEKNVHAVVVVRGGKLVYEIYRKGEAYRDGHALGVVLYTSQQLHDVRSVSKSVVSLLLGIALDQKLLASVETPVLSYFPDLQELSTPEKQRISLRHLLTMTSGLEWNEEVPYSDPGNDASMMTLSTDPYRFALDRQVSHKPGERWSYNGGNTQLLAGVLQRATGKWLDDFASEALFKPLAITQFEWMRMSGNGEIEAASGLRLRPRDMAKIGELVLNKGMWNGRRIVSESWIKESTLGRIKHFDKVASLRYGYQWWGDETKVGVQQVSWVTALGFGGQRIYVVPAFDLVVVVTAGLYSGSSQDWVPFSIFDKFVLSAIRK